MFPKQVNTVIFRQSYQVIMEYRSKKGTSIILTLFELLVIILVVLVAFSVAKDKGTSDKVVRHRVAADMVMMVHALAALPGDAVVEYPGNMTQYTIILEDDQVAVGKTNSEGFISTGESVVKGITLPISYEAEGIVKNKEKVYLKKEKNKIKVIDTKE